MRIVLAVILVLAASSAGAQEFPLDQFRTFRDQAGLSFPSWDERLAASCVSRSSQLAVSGQISHQDEQGQSPGNTLVAQGFPPGMFGEVLGAGESPSKVWEAWLASPAHRAVLADARWKRWGWGTTRLGVTVVWVVRFWAP